MFDDFIFLNIVVIREASVENIFDTKAIKVGQAVSVAKPA